MNPDLSRLTIIIPTISRPLFVGRQIRYWSQFNAQVRILDGASSPIDLTADGPIAPNVQYLHLPLRFNERLTLAGSMISTEFACLLPDDEFFMPTGLTTCIEHLDKNSHLIGAVGKVLQFFVDQGEFKAFQDYDYWKNFSQVGSDIAEGRIRQVLPPNKTHKIQFAVLRSEIWRKIFESSYSDYYSTGYLYERMLNLHAAVLGESVVLDTLLWMRSMENPPISNDAVPRNQGGMLGWADDPAMAAEVEHYFRKVLKIVAQGDGISDELAQELAHKYVYGGFDAHRAKVKRAKRRLLRRLALRVSKAAPRSLKLWAKRNMPVQILQGFDWKGFPLETIETQLTERRIQYSPEDLYRVRALALQLDALR